LPDISNSYWTTFFQRWRSSAWDGPPARRPSPHGDGGVDVTEAGVASAVNNTVARVGALLAVAVIGIVTVPLFAQALDRRLEPARPGRIGAARCSPARAPSATRRCTRLGSRERTGFRASSAEGSWNFRWWRSSARDVH
jgi:hypothetical protein